MKGINCKYCGRIYDSPSIMRTKKCHSHPKGAWCGYCTPDAVDEFSWKIDRDIEERRVRRQKEKLEASEFAHRYKQHTPLLDCVLKKDLDDDEPCGYKLEIRNADLCQLALDLANGINDKTKDAINTIYALRDGCDDVLNNGDARENGSLGAWLEEIKRLRDEVVNWDFWVALCWLTKPLSIKAAAADNLDNYEHNREDWNYWKLNSIAKLFHARYVLPMLRVLRVLKKEPDENDRAAMQEITSYVLSLPSKEKGFSRCFEKMANDIKDPKFWSVLYCLHWMKLRPTPWSDKKVWPIQVSKKLSAIVSQEPPETDSKTADLNATKRREFAEMLRMAYAKNFAPFKSLWIHNENTLVFHKLRVGRRFVGMEVAVGDKVSVSMYMNNGTLDDIKTYASKNEQLKKLFPEIYSQSLVHSKIAHTDVPAFIDKVLAALRFPNAQVAPSADSKAGLQAKVSSGDFAKKLRDDYQNRFTPFTKLWIYNANTLVFDEYNVNGKRVAMDVGISQDEVNVTLFMRNGNLNDIQSFINKNAQLKPLFPEVTTHRLRHSQIAYSDIFDFIGKVLVALRTPSSPDAQKSIPVTTVANVNSTPVAPTVTLTFNASEMLKTLRDITLGMKWRESAKKNPYWGTWLDNSLAVITWQKRFQSNLACEFNLSSDTTHIYNGECWMQCSMRFEAKDDRVVLNIWGEFWGGWFNGKRAKIDLTQSKVASPLALVEKTFKNAWMPFGVNGNIGHHERNLWFNASLPLSSLDSIKDESFGRNLRAALVTVARSFATLRPFCVWE